MADEEGEVMDSCSYDEAVELTGQGWYNRWLLVACSVISIAGALDMFGFTIVVAAASCDLQLGLRETGLLASAPFVGILFAFPWGYLADTRGRRLALLLSTSGGFILATLTSFAPTWEAMLVLKMLSCSCSSVSFSLTITYVGESVGSRHRAKYLFILTGINFLSEFVSFALAHLLLPLGFRIPMTWLSIVFRPWRMFCITMALPLGIGAVMLLYLQESPKFLADKGETEKAMEVLKIMFERNGGRRPDYPVKSLEVKKKDTDDVTFWSSVVRQTVPLFKPPLVWTTVKLYYVMMICISTNNVFLMWYPMIVNKFFNAPSEGINSEATFCQSIAYTMPNHTDIQEITCDDTISPNTLYSGMVYGIFFCIMALLVAQVANHRRPVLITTFIISAASGVLLNLTTNPAAVMIFFILLQGTSIGIGSVASFFTDLYPTAYRGLVTSLSMMFARLASMAGVNLVGAIIFTYCLPTFLCWSAFVLSGVVLTLFLPKDNAKK